MKKIIGKMTIEVVQGDIANQPGITAVVNSANAQLMPGGGVAGAIHRAAGPGLYKECKPLAPISTGQAVITKGYNLPNSYIIHTLGPVYGRDRPENKLLEDCYRNSLKVADENKIDSIAFPAISTGIFGYPPKEAAEFSLKAVKEMSKDLTFVKKVRFVLSNQSVFAIFQKALSMID
jgi:O-acetyl-ADP-ribose deacetylase (regulator of RNase III)